MKYPSLILFLILLSCDVRSQGLYYGTYTDTAGATKKAYIKGHFFGYWTDHIDISEDRTHYATVPASAIREFSVQDVWDRSHHQFTFRTVLVDGKCKFLEKARDGGKHLLLFYAGRGHYVFSKEGVALPRDLEETSGEYNGRIFADCPLLSEMARNGGFDIMYGNESKIIFEEYDKWADADSLQKTDTSMALKGVIDANRAVLPKKLFWRNFWYVHAAGILGLHFRNELHHPLKLSEMPIIDPSSMRDPDYARGYKARMFTRMTKLITKGQVMGLFLPPIIFI
jgi:hypothetical protein